MNNDEYIRMLMASRQPRFAAAVEAAVARLREELTCSSMYHNENIADWDCCYICGEGVK